jgi:hypothetical protein
MFCDVGGAIDVHGVNRLGERDIGRFAAGDWGRAGVEIAPVHDVIVLFGEPPDRDVLGESCHAGRALARQGSFAAVCALVVQVG